MKVLLTIFIALSILVGTWIGFNQLSYRSKIVVAEFPLAIGSNIEPEYGDVLIVPGGGCNPGLGTVERLNLASSLYKLKKRKLIISEGTCFPHEREGFRKRLISEWKIDSADIIWDTLSFSTSDNISNSVLIAERLNLSEAILCTSPHHQLRCWVLMSKMWKGGFKMAKMDPEMIELMKHEVYVNKRGKEIKHEYLKSLHHLVFL